MLFLTAALTLALPSAAGDEAQPRAAAAAASQPLLTGVVTDQTITLSGQEFYKQFCAFWHDKPLNEMYAVAIRERLSARRGNQVVIEYAGRVIFHAALPPARAAIGALGAQAVDIAYDTVVNAEVQRLLFREDELAPDEI